MLFVYLQRVFVYWQRVQYINYSDMQQATSPARAHVSRLPGSSLLVSLFLDGCLTRLGCAVLGAQGSGGARQLFRLRVVDLVLLCLVDYVLGIGSSYPSCPRPGPHPPPPPLCGGHSPAAGAVGFRNPSRGCVSIRTEPLEFQQIP